MSVIAKLRKRHEKEINDFQKACPHKKSKWFDHMWAPGHFGLPVRVCLRCEKILEHTKWSDPVEAIGQDSQVDPGNNTPIIGINLNEK